MNAKTAKIKSDADGVIAETDLPKTDVAVAAPSGGAVALNDAMDFEADAGKGSEGVDKDSQAVPFLSILQGLSPQMETVPGAKLGLIINTVTNELFDAIEVIFAGFQRNYNIWTPRSKGGGYQGKITVAEFEERMYRKEINIVENDKGRKVAVDKAGMEYRDTRNHFVLVVRPDGTYSPALMSMSSSQIKHSKRLNGIIKGIQIRGANGVPFNPPSFSHAYRVGPTLKESNNDGSWYSWTFTKIGQLTKEQAYLYKAAKEFNDQVMAGEVKIADPIEATDVEEVGAGGEGKNF